MTYDRTGEPTLGIICGRTSDEARIWGQITEPSVLSTAATTDWNGRNGTLAENGTFSFS